MKSLLNEYSFLLGMNRHNWYKMDLVMALIGFTLTGINEYIELFIWHSAYSLYVILSLIFIDIISGTALAVTNLGFETNKAMRGVAKLAVYPFLLALSFNLGKYEPMFAWLPSILMFPMALILFLSILKNLTLLRLVDTKITNFIIQYIDKHKETLSDVNNDK